MIPAFACPTLLRSSAEASEANLKKFITKFLHVCESTHPALSAAGRFDKASM
jgi:hypothetical protein